MSRKWQQTQRWDAEHLTGALRPVRWVLHALSSIWFAVILLVCVGLYGSLASIPIGLVALAPTWALIAASLAVCVAVGGSAGAFLGGKLVPPTRRGVRFALMLFLLLVGAAALAVAWYELAWPAMKYDPATGHGLRFFAGFVDAYRATTLRRLPGFEMSELEFYSWWPMRAMLVLFVVNLAVATIRRIDFSFKNIGVLTVHTGIIVIALGSVYYQSMKQEGDTLLRAGMPDDSGKPGVGPLVQGFYDNTAVALWIAERSTMDGAPMWEQRRLTGIPRYNDYALDAANPKGDGVTVVGPAATLREDPARHLDLAVPAGGAIDPMLNVPRVDTDISFRVVGYASYAQPAQSLVVVDGQTLAQVPESERRPLRVIELLSRLPDNAGHAPDPDTPALTYTLSPREPANRASEDDSLGVEYTIGMDPTRVQDLLTPMPQGANRALVVEVPAAAGEDGSVPRAVVPATVGVRHEIGDTGWKVGVKQVLPQPPFPIITRGYENATSSVAIVEITPPEGEAYERWVYHRYGEIDQDMVPTDTGRPARRDADPSIRVSFVDASKLQLYFNETPTGQIDLIARTPGGGATLIEDVQVGQRIGGVVPMIDFRISGAYAHAGAFEFPMPVPESDRDKRAVGTHAEAMLAVEVTAADPTSTAGPFRRVVWVPYVQYLGIDPDRERTISLPGGRSLTLQFGRVWHGFPNFGIQLVDFQMIAYDYRGAPRDYQSMVQVSPMVQNAGFDLYQHVVRLNSPLRAPYIWSASRGLLANVGLRMTSGLNPSQYKLSQSGWDRDGWMRTQQMTDAGQLKRPFARYTILQVGNNPGIHIIAFGGILMSIGIPWAFYVKPLLVKREKRKLAGAALERKARATKQTEVVVQEAAGDPVG